jgi:hypothetical protein
MVDTLQDAVLSLTAVVNPLSNIADRIPLARPRRRSSARVVASQRVIDQEM